MKLTILTLLFLLSCENNNTRLPYYVSVDLTPQWFESEQKKLHKISPFNLINQYGARVTEQSFENSIYIANFIFTTCNGICPDMTTNMTKVQSYFKTDKLIKLISHSVTPEIDTVTVLKSFADENNAIKDKWHFVTGDRNQIYTLARNSYFADQDIDYSKTTNDFLHTENFYLIDKRRHIRGVYNGVLPADVERLIEDIRILKDEES